MTIVVTGPLMVKKSIYQLLAKGYVQVLVNHRRTKPAQEKSD